ncbi:hypothetical protein ER308_00590 [Egibacter rhizosphaerae]|uniref:Uncharacterized protein n=1 Tax=Egibacter rhizosphaerae TaxID=1670831 RepID=A0A411YAL2_9ACTN|nr:hypothetical protein [Egibacter rhizosphaerae]QBI18217.1 hypothetical protein ER308_00590 [Egibacter rhizosphaerae]
MDANFPEAATVRNGPRDGAHDGPRTRVDGVPSRVAPASVSLDGAILAGDAPAAEPIVLDCEPCPHTRSSECDDCLVGALIAAEDAARAPGSGTGDRPGGRERVGLSVSAPEPTMAR